MDGLLVKNIPRPLLARILVQLYIIPQQLINSPRFDLLAVLVAGLQEYGDGDDLNGFLSFCAQQSLNCLEPTSFTSDMASWTSSTWLWRDHTLSSLADWDRIDQDQLEEQDSHNRCDTTLEKTTGVIGLRLQLASEKARLQLELVRYGKKVATLHDERFTCIYEGQHISLENILNSALDYMSNRDSPSAETALSASTTTSTTATTTTIGIHTDTRLMSALLKQRIKELGKDHREYEQKFIGRSETDFVLMGALMVKLDATLTNGALEDDWYLYLRDYTVDSSGSNWRIIKGSKSPIMDEVEMRVSSHQVLADLRGVKVKNDQGLECVPSPTSNKYRPVYVFYCNNDVVSRSAQDSLEKSGTTASFENTHHDETTTYSTVEQKENQNITFEDYSFENDGNNMDYEMQDGDDDDDLAMEMCKICGIPESIDDINTIFFCDECNLGVHQLCEQPPIAAFEMNVDPWYCRDCCARKGIPLPTPPDYITPRVEESPSTTITTNPVLQLTTTTPISTHHPPSPSTSPNATTKPTMAKVKLDHQLPPSTTTGTNIIPSAETKFDSINTHATNASNSVKRKLED